jgi:hypothetical protein
MPMTPEQAKALLGVLAAYWPKADLPRETLLLYRDHLLDFELEPAARAVSHLGATSRFFPTVAEVRQAITAAADPDPLPDPDQAWAEVVANARDGIYGTPIWSHPAVYDTVKAMGGIRELAISENLMADRAHFLRLYETCKARADRAKQLPSQDHVDRLLDALGGQEPRAIEGRDP